MIYIKTNQYEAGNGKFMNVDFGGWDACQLIYAENHYEDPPPSNSNTCGAPLTARQLIGFNTVCGETFDASGASNLRSGNENELSGIKSLDDCE